MTSLAEAPIRSRRTLALGLLGSLLCYLAHPPVAWSLLAWIGPTPWLLLVRGAKLPGRRPYLAMWFAGFTFWLAAIQWIRLPFWANIFGLFLIAAYLGAYLPLFVALSRVAVHRVRAPLWLAAPVVWTGLELVRAHLLTGFLMASLAHTQVRWPFVIQIADLGGEYMVTFLIVLVAASIAAAVPLDWALPMASSEPRPPLLRAFAGLLPAVAAILLSLVYGFLSARDVHLVDLPNRQPQNVAIIQTDMLSDWKGTPERDRKAMEQQIEMSIRAVESSERRIDLIVWPETMFRQALFVADAKNPPPEGSIHPSRFTAALSDLKSLAERTNAALIVGIDRVLASRVERPGEPPDAELLVYNAAVCVDRSGELAGAYAKMHLLPFGEFIPFAQWLPMLAAYAPITGNSLWGDGAAAFDLEGVTYVPNICYESVLPHLIRRQVLETRQQGKTADVLVNLTNDAWFWGSSELDMHLACGVFRAVEMRKPMIVAANRGLSAYISEFGVVVAKSERDRPETLVVDVHTQVVGDPVTVYARFGDWFAGACLACVVGLSVAECCRRRLPSPAADGPNGQ